MRKWLQIVTYITLLSSIRTRRCSWWERFWLQKKSLQLFWHQTQWSVIPLRRRLHCWRSMCSLSVIRDAISYRWNQGSEMWWGDCWSRNISARSTDGKLKLKWCSKFYNNNIQQIFFIYNFVCYSFSWLW